MNLRWAFCYISLCSVLTCVAKEDMALLCKPEMDAHGATRGGWRSLAQHPRCASAHSSLLGPLLGLHQFSMLLVDKPSSKLCFGFRLVPMNIPKGTLCCMSLGRALFIKEAGSDLLRARRGLPIQLHHHHILPAGTLVNEELSM